MNKEESTRQLKVSRQIQKDLAEIIRLKGMAVFSGAMVTVSGVRITPDLSLARVFISVFPSSKREDAMAVLTENSRTIRGELGAKVSKQLRIVPELEFMSDDSLDYIEHIDNLLKG